MSELTLDQKSRRYCQEQNKCASCKYVDQEAYEKYESCCTYGFKLEFSSGGICLTRYNVREATK